MSCFSNCKFNIIQEKSLLSIKTNKGISNMKNMINGLKNSCGLQLIVLFAAFSPVHIFAKRMLETNKDVVKSS